MLFLQGENDYGITNRENYLNMLNQLINDFNADARAITGQTDNIGFYLYQTGGTYVSQAEGNTLPIDMAQLDITSRVDAFMAAPMFPYPQASIIALIRQQTVIDGGDVRQRILFFAC